MDGENAKDGSNLDRENAKDGLQRIEIATKKRQRSKYATSTRNLGKGSLKRVIDSNKACLVGTSTSVVPMLSEILASIKGGITRWTG